MSHFFTEIIYELLLLETGKQAMNLTVNDGDINNHDGGEIISGSDLSYLFHLIIFIFRVFCFPYNSSPKPSYRFVNDLVGPYFYQPEPLKGPAIRSSYLHD